MCSRRTESTHHRSRTGCCGSTTSSPPTCSASWRHGRWTSAASTARCSASPAASTCVCCGGAPTSSRRRLAPGTRSSWPRVRVHRQGVGLFGLFFELVVGAGGSLFDDGCGRRWPRPKHRCGRAAPAARRAGARGPPHLALRRRRRRAARRAGGDGRSVAGRHRSHPSERALRTVGARRATVAGPTPAATGGPSRAPVATSPPMRSSSSSRCRGGRGDAASGTVPANRVALEAHDPVDDVDAERLPSHGDVIATACSPTRPCAASPRWRTPGGGRSTRRCAASGRPPRPSPPCRPQLRRRVVIEGSGPSGSRARSPS